MRIKTITVDGFNSNLFDTEVNKFINRRDISVLDISFDTVFASNITGRNKMIYTAFIKYEEKED